MTDQIVSLLQLVKRRDADNTDIDAMDFLALPTELQYQGWNQGLPQPNLPSVDESITLVMNAGNANTLATALQSIDTKIKEIGWAQDPLNPVGVWLRAQLSGETGQRQCFILAAKRPPRGLEITNPLAYSNIIPNYNLGLTRMPTWENPLITRIESANPVTIHGGLTSYTVAGDAHARVALQSVVKRGGNSITEFWIGAKSGRYGVDPANFEPIYNLDKNGYSSVVDTSSSSDATALDGKKMVCTFGTTAMSYRAVVQITDITSNYGDQRGRYLALLRAKTTDASLVANIRVGQGYLASSTSVNSFAFQPRVQISAGNTGWRYYTLGQVMLPALTGFTGSSGTFEMKHAAIAIQAEKVSGSGNLEMDSVILVPAEHSIHVSFANALDVDTRTLYLVTRPDKKYYGAIYDNTSAAVIESVTPDQITWSIPSGAGVLVCVGSSAATSLSDTIFTRLYTCPSYNSLRGSA